MAGKKGSDNSKKAQGRARKAEAEEEKANKAAAAREAAEAETWKSGSKDDSKREAAAAKKADAARKKAERDALLAEEEGSLKSAKGASKKERDAAAAAKKKGPAKGLQLDDIDGLGSDEGSGPNSGGGLAELHASGIDNALDALSLTSPGTRKVEKHPERRFKAAYAVFEERRLKEVGDDGSMDGLRLNQKKDRIRKEFEKSEENPFNQTTAEYNATRDETRAILDAEAKGIEARLASPRVASP